MPGRSFSLLSSHNTPPSSAPLPDRWARLPFLERGQSRSSDNSRMLGFTGPRPDSWNPAAASGMGQVPSRPVGERFSFRGAACNLQATCVRRRRGSRPLGWVLAARLVGAPACQGAAPASRPAAWRGVSRGVRGRRMGVPRWGSESSSSVPGHVTWVGRLTPLSPSLSLKLALRTP